MITTASRCPVARRPWIQQRAGMPCLIKVQKGRDPARVDLAMTVIAEQVRLGAIVEHDIADGRADLLDPGQLTEQPTVPARVGEGGMSRESVPSGHATILP
jgi:hypothetical protein